LTPRLRSAVRLAAASVCLVLSSCDRGKSAKLYPVTGKVFYQNQPAEGALVVFQPVNSGSESLMPSGTVGPDGSFKLTTHGQGEGAPAGEYVVLITWYPPNARELDNPKNKLPARYASPAESRLTATVKEGNNELEPFQLTK
jgi:hypothetical protein